MKWIKNVALLGIAGYLLTGCGGISNGTSMDAAKTFMSDVVQGDAKAMDQINHSSPLDYPTQHVIEIANNQNLVGKKLDDFKFEGIDDKTVKVSWKQGDQAREWKLHFLKEKDGYFFSSLGN